jgi:NADH-quinone oxidoreductase subunit N
VGNLAAIMQNNLKRMLAYSTIANMGFMLLGMTAGVVNNNTLSAANAYSSAMFYTVTYVLTTLGTFGMVILLSRQGHEAEEIKDLAGLAKRSPWFALVMTMFMFSLAGVPPMVGFHAKLAVFAVVVSLVGAFYYLRVVKVMFFDEPTDTAAIAAPTDVRLVMTLNGAAVLVFGLLPGGLLDLCKIAIRQALTT